MLDKFAVRRLNNHALGAVLPSRVPAAFPQNTTVPRHDTFSAFLEDMEHFLGFPDVLLSTAMALTWTDFCC